VHRTRLVHLNRVAAIEPRRAAILSSTWKTASRCPEVADTGKRCRG
jgi:hypothetical protein